MRDIILKNVQGRTVMTDSERRAAAKQFAADWQGRGGEKQETQTFWLALLQKVYGVSEPDKFIQFEVPVRLSHTSFMTAISALPAC